MAYTSCDAICKAIDLFFDGDEAMPLDGLVVMPALDTLPRAAEEVHRRFHLLPAPRLWRAQFLAPRAHHSEGEPSNERT